MAYPDFSEFSFGYTVVREIEDQLGGKLAAPTFPTQPDEATKGYDVDFLGHGIPLFLQFKRSDVLTRSSCRECKVSTIPWSKPIYRMNLHRKNGYQQHFLMQGLESEGNTALYCTSQVPDKQSLDAHYSASTMLSAAAFFSPNEINLPNTHEHHHVSFNSNSPVAYLFSTAPSSFDRKFARFDAVRDKLRPLAEMEPNGALEQLTRWVNAVDERGATAYARDQRTKYERERGLEPDSLRVSSEDMAYIPVAPQLPRLARDHIRSVESVVKRAALLAYYEMDSFLISVSRAELSRLRTH